MFLGNSSSSVSYILVVVRKNLVLGGHSFCTDLNKYFISFHCGNLLFRTPTQALLCFRCLNCP
jgi:hypothetical protein